jgi:hypothetical protein
MTPWRTILDRYRNNLRDLARGEEGKLSKTTKWRVSQTDGAVMALCPDVANNHNLSIQGKSLYLFILIVK